MRTLSVGSLARNICSRLVANRDPTEYPFKSIEFFNFFRAQRALAEKIARRIGTCVETAQLYQRTIYEIIMLAIDDIKDPTRLQQQSRQQRPSGLSAPKPWQLPESYDSTFVNTLLDQKVIYGLSSFVFTGGNRATQSASARTADEDEEDAERPYASTRHSATRKTDYSKNYVKWIFERYRHETGFIPFARRNIRILHAEATRSAASDVLEAIETHYKYAVVSHQIFASNYDLCIGFAC